MSGIAGVIRLDGSPVGADEMSAMLATLSRRGPDRQSAWQTGGTGIGQTLLITTPEAKNEPQPWIHAGSGCVVASDSRLDEREALARSLDVVFDDIDRIGDGELLYAAWRRWGSTCPSHLSGDFAFVIWDPGARTLFCARDRFGIRPLYLHHAPGRLFALASEPAALLALRDVPRTLDEGRLADVLVPQLEGVDRTSTFHRGISRLPAAHALELVDGRLTMKEYWRPLTRHPFPDGASDEQWIEGLRHRLQQAVVRCLRAEAVVGSMLSGGLDSSAIVALAHRHQSAEGGPPLPTFSAVDRRGTCAETRAVDDMLASFAVDATQVDADDCDAFLDRIAGEPAFPDEPFDISMTLLASQYLAAADKGVRVVLDGIDADNLLSHGDYLGQLLDQGRWRQAWHEAREESHFLGMPFSPRELLQPWLARRCLPDAVRIRLRTLRKSLSRRTVARERWLDPQFARRVDLPGRLRRLAESVEAQQHVAADGVTRTWIMSPYGAAGIERYHRVATLFGVEPRHPFLDVDLVEFASWIPDRLLLRDGYPKWALRRAMTGLLPDRVAWRRGKEHLGPRFNRQLLERLRTRTGDVPSGLEGLVCPAARPPWPAPDADRSGRPDWEDELALRALAGWLDRQEGGPG